MGGSSIHIFIIIILRNILIMVSSNNSNIIHIIYSCNISYLALTIRRSLNFH